MEESSILNSTVLVSIADDMISLNHHSRMMMSRASAPHEIIRSPPHIVKLKNPYASFEEKESDMKKKREALLTPVVSFAGAFWYFAPWSRQS